MPNRERFSVKVISVLALTIFLFIVPVLFSSVSANATFAGSSLLSPKLHNTLPRNAPISSTQGAFAFVSNFESQTLEGWQSVSGFTPNVVTKTNYYGEPSLASSASVAKGSQVDVAAQGFVIGDSFISFQVAMNTKRGSGYFGLEGPNGFVVAVGLSNGMVVAGPDLSNMQSIEHVPSGSAYPSGWVYISANVYDSSTTSNKNAGWVMQVFVDSTDQIAATIAVPNAANYIGGMIETTSGTVYYTNIVISTYEIGINIPGYNNMEGYGQGSGLLVSLLPAFDKLSAEMTLNSWNTPQEGILSFQFNAMNYYGTTRSTCGGFFQLGVDLNPDGYIAPWYVPGKNCIAHYFLNSNNPAIQQGIPSPYGTHLLLSIVDNQSEKSIVFTIVDTTTSQTFTTSVPYSGTEFYGAYTQLEFQPCCSTYPIQDYHFNGELNNMQITAASGQIQSLSSSYMLPFTLDAPTTWSFTYYQDSSQGYQQLS